MNRRILICDDIDGMRRYLAKMLGSWGYTTAVFADPLQLLKAVEDGEPGDLLLLDVRMPQLDGIETLRRLKGLRPELPVIIMTGHGSIDTAVEAMKLGAYDYLTKPFPEEKLAALVRHSLEREDLLEENSLLRRRLEESGSRIVLSGPAFAAIHELAVRAAASDFNVLILGESGTGKELIAETIHQASPRHNANFVAINCAALTETLLESQLFGHLRGAFTGALQARKGLLEEADGGTLFLDEVGDLSLPLQAKLLRVLESGEFIPVGATRPRQVDVRYVAATNKNLEQEVAAGRFRDDLFYRLNVVVLHLPPLRERTEDIEPLARHFLEEIARKSRQPLKTFSAEALTALRTYAWPGNVRELRNIVERCTILARGDTIDASHLPFRPAPPPLPASRLRSAGELVPAGSRLRSAAERTPPLNLRDSERQLVVQALRQTGGNKSQAADLLGVTRKTLDRKIKEYSISPLELGRSR